MNKSFDADEDFQINKAEENSSHKAYASFLRAKQLKQELPKNSILSNDVEFFRFFKEVDAEDRVSSILFRRKSDAPQALITVWLSRVREVANALAILNKVPKFDGIDLQSLAAIGKTSSSVNSISNLQSHLFDRGIILVYERALPGMKLDGAAFRLSNGTPVVALSLRYSRLDHFWFTLMHELVHVALHYDQLNEPIVDDLDSPGEDDIEVEANHGAANSLISRSDWRSCNALYVQRDEEVIEFAKLVSVHPSIVAGRIRRELNRHTLFSKIINENNVRSILLNEQ
jgi:HTH-type transcriptional regulator/antitoxin HigA